MRVCVCARIYVCAKLTAQGASLWAVCTIRVKTLAKLWLSERNKAPSVLLHPAGLNPQQQSGRENVLTALVCGEASLDSILQPQTHLHP